MIDDCVVKTVLVRYKHRHTSYIVERSEHKQHLQHTTGKGGMRDTSWPKDKHKMNNDQLIGHKS